MSYEQYEIDLRFDYERDLKTNIATTAKFAGRKMAEDMEAVGRPLATIRNTQEAYGVAAQQFVRVLGKMKIMKGEMNDFLKILDGDTGAAQVAGALYNSGIELAQEAVVMAAQAHRIMEDLYYGQTTPLEDMADDEDDYSDIDEEEE